MANKTFTLRMDEQLLHKLHVVADYEARSANSQVLILIRRCVEEFEEKHGKIEL